MSVPPTAGESRLPGPRKVLLVEDDDDHAALFQRALRADKTIEVTRASRGEEALERLRTERFDLMVLDLNMPGIRGFEVLSRVRANDETRRLPTVVLSTSAAPSDTALAYELTANSYLVKPTDWREFREMVGRMTEYWLELNQPAAF